jgi:hypothetical protein
LSEPLALEDLLGRQLPHGLLPIPMTTDFGVARVWMRDHTSAGVEGVAVEQLVHGLFSRNNRDISGSYPDAAALPAEEGLVLDGVIWGRMPRVQHVADRRWSLPRSSLWTAYLWPVYDGRRPRGGCSRVVSPDERDGVLERSRRWLGVRRAPRWADPLPVPEWVGQLRKVLAPGSAFSA